MHPQIGKPSWPKQRLGLLSDEVRELYEPTVNEDLQYIGLEHIEQGSLTLCGVGLSSETQSTKKVFRADDILFGTLRPYFRKVVRAKFDGVCSTDITVIRIKEKADRDFLFYFIANHPFIEYATTSSSGTRMPRAKWSHLSTIEWNIPKLKEREKIGAILSAYDDLIESNIRRIKILEEMAQTLYREWFVKFRFPGHRKVKMVDSPLGKIPEGWEMKRIGDVCTVVPGYAFKSSDWQKSGIPVIKIKNINSDNTVNTDETDCVSEDLLNSAMEKFLLKDGDNLIAMTGATAGKIGKLRSKQGMLLNQRVAKIEPHNPYNAFVWCTICTEECQARFFRLSDGAAQPNMSGHQIEGFPILLPIKALCEDFSEMVNPFLLEIDNLIHTNRNLRQTRDLLLPKLISGELDVSELDITIPEANA